ncbi:MAG: rhamnan synthesis F family protein [Chitinophagaceae bacterium]
MVATKSYLCLFAHYNPNRVVYAATFHYIEALTKVGVRVVFISNSEIITDSRRKLLAFVKADDIYIRENKGNDFGAWSWWFKKYSDDYEFDNLILTNDSLFGPVKPLKPILLHFEGLDFDWWGLCESNSPIKHVQSFFLCFSKLVVHSDGFKRVLMQDFDRMTRDEIIKNGELLLSKALFDAGFRYDVYCKIDTARFDPAFIESRNPTHFFWIELINSCGFPFIKKDLILKNPENLLSVGDLFEVLEESCATSKDEMVEWLHEQYMFKDGSISSVASEVNVLCHLFFPHFLFRFLFELNDLRAAGASFLFNVAGAIKNSKGHVALLRRLFAKSIIISCPDKGRDIGAKLALLELRKVVGFDGKYIFFCHDKLSLHSPDAARWRDRLMSTIKMPEMVKAIETLAADDKVGAVAPVEYLRRLEYDNIAESNAFYLRKLMEKYHMGQSSGLFVAGSIFLSKAIIWENFLQKHSAMECRSVLESGNVDDSYGGTFTHAWERLFGCIIYDSGYKLNGI